MTLLDWDRSVLSGSRRLPEYDGVARSHRLSAVGTDNSVLSGSRRLLRGERVARSHRLRAVGASIINTRSVDHGAFTALVCFSGGCSSELPA